MALYTTLISDCDGVLIDSEVMAHEVLLREAQKVFPSVDCQKFLIDSFGKKTEELVRQIALKANKAVPEGFQKQLQLITDVAIEQGSPPINAVDILINIPQLKAVVSNSGMARVISAVNKVGLNSRPDVKIFSADQVKLPKPSPDLYLLAARELGVLPSQCLVIEDSGTGVMAAKAAGMSVLGFVGGLHIPAQHAADLHDMGVLAVFDDMRDLPALLERVANWAPL